MPSPTLKLEKLPEIIQSYEDLIRLGIDCLLSLYSFYICYHSFHGFEDMIIYILSSKALFPLIRKDQSMNLTEKNPMGK